MKWALLKLAAVQLALRVLMRKAFTLPKDGHTNQAVNHVLELLVVGVDTFVILKENSWIFLLFLTLI